MHFIFCGLGNPGSEYENTRHNIGFKVLDALAQKYEASWKNDRLATVAEIKIKGKFILLIKPQTYMNLSGKAVQYWLQKEKTDKANLIVITDDLALPVGKLRLKTKGSDGGHNGLKSINESLNSQDYPRLRFGIGNEFSKGRQVDFVLGTWGEEEQKTVEEGIAAAVKGLEMVISTGTERAMNEINKK